MEKVANYEPLEEDLAAKEDLGQSVFDEIAQKDTEIVQGKPSRVSSSVLKSPRKPFFIGKVSSNFFRMKKISVPGIIG